MCRVWYYPQFQAPLEDLERIPPTGKEGLLYTCQNLANGAFYMKIAVC